MPYLILKQPVSREIVYAIRTEEYQFVALEPETGRPIGRITDIDEHSASMPHAMVHLPHGLDYQPPVPHIDIAIWIPPQKRWRLSWKGLSRLCGDVQNLTFGIIMVLFLLGAIFVHFFGPTANKRFMQISPVVAEQTAPGASTPTDRTETPPQ